MGGSRSAVLGATRSCLAGGRSWLLRSYAAIGFGLIVIASALIVLALPTWIALAEGTSATVMLSQGLLVLGGLGVIVALFLPIYLAHRRLPDPGQNRPQERAYGAIGYAIALGVYVGLLISAPSGARDAPPAALAPVIDPLYGLDPIFGVVPVFLALALLAAFERFS